MAINIICENSKCKHNYEYHCMKNIHEERLEINDIGQCNTFEEGVSEMYDESRGELNDTSTERIDLNIKALEKELKMWEMDIYSVMNRPEIFEGLKRKIEDYKKLKATVLLEDEKRQKEVYATKIHQH